MKKLLIPAMLVILASCAHMEQDATLPQEPIVPEGYKVLTVRATKTETDTKTTYAGEKKFSWNAGDKISVLCNDGTSNFWQEFTATSTGAATSFTATVGGTVNLGPKNLSDPKVAMYPASASHQFDGGLAFHIPAERDFRVASGGHQESAIPMFAWGTDSDTYAFSNLTGAAKFSFKGLSCAAVKMTFTTSNVKLNGTYNLIYDAVNKTDASNVYWNAANGASAAEKTVTYYADVTDGRVSFYLPYAEGGIWGYSTLKLYDASTDEELYSNDHVNTINITKNRIAVLPTLSVGGSSAYGIHWENVNAAENTVAAQQVIRSMKATYDETYLYVLLDVDPANLTLSHTYCHYIKIYASSASGSSNYWTGNKSTQIGTSAWGVYNGDIAFLNWESQYSTNLHASAGKWSYEVRIERSISDLLSSMDGVRLGAVIDDTYTDDGANYYHLSGYTPHGVIPAQGSAMYPLSAKPAEAGDPLPESLISVGFTESDEEVINPERGLYKHFEYKFDGGVPSTSIASYTFDEPLVLTIFYLKDYRTSDHLPDAVLNKLDAEWAAAKAKGKKIIARFAYEWTKESPHEPSPEQVLSQINDLEAKFIKYEDVLFLVQAGFIGTYGEWYYKESDFTWTVSGSTLSGFDNASSVLTRMLAKVPSSRQIAVRTPFYKRWHLHPTSINAGVDAITSWGTSPNQRIGYYNDGFRGSSSDIGTFNSQLDRDWWYDQGEWLICGGESAYVGTDSNHNDKLDAEEKQAWIDANPTLADPDNTIAAIREQHFTYLHNAETNILMDYWAGPNPSGKSDVSCGTDRMPDIRKALGYRLVLGDVDFEFPALTSGSTVTYSIKMKNTGSAPVIYPRPFKLVLMHSSGDPTVLDDLGDVRDIKPGTGYSSLAGSFNLTADVVHGDKLAIWLPDNAEDLRGTPAYSIRLANKEVTWDNGYNVIWSF